MKHGLPSTACFLLLFAAGCSTPPPRCLEPVATISNSAVLTYTFGGDTPFALTSDPVEIVVLAPSDDTTSTAPQADPSKPERLERDLAEPSPGEVLSAPSENMQDTRPPVQADVEEAQDTAGPPDLQESIGGTSIPERESGKASSREHSRTSSASAVLQRASMSEKSFSEAGHTDSHLAGTEDRSAQAKLRAISLSTRSTSTAQQPTIMKSATQDRVDIGEKFAYVIAIHNACPIDLAFAQVTDVLDPELWINVASVRTKPNAKVETDFSDGTLTVTFPRGLRRGKTISITIPVVVSPRLTGQSQARREDG